MANSFVRYTGNGTTTTYAIPFSYRDTADLSATVAGVNITAYTLDAAGTNLTFTTAPANGSAIEIRRTTSQTTKLVDYVSGSVLTESDLDTDSDQAFYMSQEAIDKAGDVISLDNVDFNWDVQNKRLTNVADPVNNTDAVNKQFISNNIPNINTVAGISSDVTDVANIASNVTAVANDATDIGTVATNMPSITTVATNINDVIKVADDLNEAISEVETVANDLNEATSEIEVVANNIVNVNTVGTMNADVTTVANNETDIQTLADLEDGTVTTNVLSTLAGIDTEIQGVYNIRTNVTNVDTNATNVNLVAGQISPTNNISAVGAVTSEISTLGALGTEITNLNNIRTDISGVNTISADVTAVNNNSANITAVNNNETNINAVNANETNINAVKTNEANINAVNANETNINTVAGLDTEITALGASGTVASINTVTGNLSGVNYFGERYRVSATAPTTSLDVGDLYYDTGTDTMRVYGSSGWQNAGSSVNGTSQRYNYTATSGQTTFTGSDNNGNTLTYDAGYIDVYLNGSKLLNGTDVTVTSGSSVVLASGATTGDVVDIVAYGTFSVASLNADNLTSGTVPDARITGAYTGITNLTMSGDLTVNDGNKIQLTKNTTNAGDSLGIIEFHDENGTTGANAGEFRI